jgi:hypothetical protein
MLNMAQTNSQQDGTPSSDSRESSLNRAEREIIRERAAKVVENDYEAASKHWFDRLTKTFSWKRRSADIDRAAGIVPDTGEVDQSKIDERVKLSEKERETLEAVYSELDNQADELAKVYQLIEKKSIWKKAAEKSPRLAKFIQNDKVITALGAAGGIWAGFKTASISRGIRGASRAFTGAGVVGGAIGGALAGGVSGYIKESGKVHRVEAWLNESRINEVAEIESIEQASRLDHQRLDEIATVLASAFSDNRVRDDAEQTLALASKFRMIKLALAQQEQEPKTKTEQADQNWQLLNRLDQIEAADQEFNQILIDSASERNRATYQSILKEKGRKIRDRVIVGVIAGGAAGALFGYLSSEEGEEKINDLIHGKISLFGMAHAEAATDQAQEIDPENLGNQAYEHYGQWLASNQAKIDADSDYANWVEREDVNPFGYGSDLARENTPNGEVFVNVFSPEKYQDQAFADLITGLGQENYSEVIDEAMKHNIDLTITGLEEEEDLFGGLTFAQYLHENQNKLVSLSKVQQWEIISHPELAKDILENPNAAQIAQILKDSPKGEENFLSALQGETINSQQAGESSGVNQLMSLLTIQREEGLGALEKIANLEIAGEAITQTEEIGAKEIVEGFSIEDVPNWVFYSLGGLAGVGAGLGIAKKIRSSQERRRLDDEE